MAAVTALRVAPIKGLRLVPVDAVDLRPAGPAGDRAFHLREPEGGIALTLRNPRLVQVVPAWDGNELALTFPDGTRVAGPVERGAPVTTAFYDGRPVAGHVVEGPFAAALSDYAGHPLQLVAREEHETGGDDHAVTLMSRASLAALGTAMDGDGDVDARRFRMTIEIDGAAAWEEHGWAGRDVRVGDAVLRVAAPVVRCAVTTRDPESGRTDAPVLRALARLRGTKDVTFGVWCDVVEPGAVRIGDPIVVGASGR